MTNYRVKVEKAMNLLKEATKEVEAVIACDPKNELFYERMDRNNLYDIVPRLKPILDLVDYNECGFEVSDDGCYGHNEDCLLNDYDEDCECSDCKEEESK